MTAVTSLPFGMMPAGRITEWFAAPEWVSVITISFIPGVLKVTLASSRSGPDERQEILVERSSRMK